MKSDERLQTIQTLLSVRGRVTVVELAQQFQVAQETIRRDLQKLEKNGVVQKIHGGAISSQNKYEQSLAARLTHNIREKNALARVAVGLIPPGSTLFIDFGTTTNAFAEHVKELSDLTVFTNSAMIAATLSQNPSCEVFVIGGRYDDKIKAVYGTMAMENIRNYYADFAVIGIGGVDPEIGFSDQHIGEAEIAKTMLARSNESIVLADPSKFNRHGVAHVADFTQIDHLVSSEPPDDNINAVLESYGVSVRFPNQ